MTKKTNKASQEPPNPFEYRELATLLSAGIPAADGWSKSSLMNHPAGKAIHRQLSKGSSFADALTYFNLISPSERIALSASENAGKLSSALDRMALDSENREQRRRQMQSKWGLVYLLLIIGWLAGSISASVASPEQTFNIIFTNTLKTLPSIVLIAFLNKLCLKEGWWWLSIAWRFGLQRRKAFRLAFSSAWLELLARQLAAGVDAATALSATRELITAPAYRAALTRAIGAANSGQSLGASLSNSGLLVDPALQQILVSAEASGDLGSSLDHHAKIAEQNLSLLIDRISLWLPKIIYALSGAMALSMVL